MHIDRENIIKLFQNCGQYLIDNAEKITGQDIKNLTKRVVTITIDIDAAIPRMSIDDTYVAPDILNGVKFMRCK